MPAALVLEAFVPILAIAVLGTILSVKSNSIPSR